MDIPLPYVVAIVTTLSGTVAVLWRVNQAGMGRRIVALEKAVQEKDGQIQELWERVNQLTGDAAAVRGCTVKHCPVRVDERTSRVPLPLRPAIGLWLALAAHVASSVTRCHLTLTLCALLILSSCIAAGGKGDSWAAVSIGTDARRLSASRHGLEVTEMNQSRGLEMARKQLRNAALIGAGVPAIKEVAKEAIP